MFTLHNQIARDLYSPEFLLEIRLIVFKCIFSRDYHFCYVEIIKLLLNKNN
jgi:hypothetical protein